MKKIIRIIFLIIIIIVIIFTLRFFIGGSEDDWICVNGEWTKHGVPYAPMPEGECNLLDNFNPF